MSMNKAPMNGQTFADFATGALSATANAETQVGTINVKPGGTIKRISYAVRATQGTIWAIRLDYTGIVTPQKYVPPAVFSGKGTEAALVDVWGSPGIDVNIPIPSNCSQITLFATGDTASMTVALGLVWQ